jgi:hypothetical protein
MNACKCSLQARLVDCVGLEHAAIHPCRIVALLCVTAGAEGCNFGPLAGVAAAGLHVCIVRSLKLDQSHKLRMAEYSSTSALHWPCYLCVL